MRGKFITTNLKLAVLAGGKKSSILVVKETSAKIDNFETIWTKDRIASGQKSTAELKTQKLELV